MSKVVSVFSRVLLGFLLVLTLLPFYLLVINAFKSQTEIILNPFRWASSWQFQNFAKAAPQIYRPMANTLFVTVAVIGITLLVSLLASFDDPGVCHADSAVCADHEAGII